MKHYLKILLYTSISFLFIAGCHSGGGVSKAKADEARFHNFYLSYIKSIQQSKFPKNINEYFSQRAISKFKSEYNLTEITAPDVAWIVHSTYMPRKSLRNHYLTYNSDSSTCLTIIGESHESLPMYVSFFFIDQGDNEWRIEKFEGHSFDKNIEPSFPQNATCPKEK